MSFPDLDTSGVDFSVSRFNGAAIYSKPDLTCVALGGPYDLIWIGSLFTHVDWATTRAWLAHLVASLTEDGVLVATFHGHWSIEVNEHHTPADSRRRLEPHPRRVPGNRVRICSV